MSRDYRREVLKRLPERLRAACTLSDLEREYTLSEIAVVTRAGPARMLGLPHKGHLGVGADADVTVYTRTIVGLADGETVRVEVKRATGRAGGTNG